MEADDRELVARVLQGDSESFAKLYDRYARLVRAVCADETRNLTAAQDLTQDVFLRAYQRLADLREPAKFGAWVVGIARVSTKEWRRGQARERTHAAPENLEEQISRDARAEDDRLDVLLSLVEELPESERLALHAFYLQARNAEQAAVIVGRSRSGFYKLLDSAKRRLEQRYWQTQERSP